MAEPAVVPASPHPGADLRAVVEQALAGEGHLLTAGELVVCRRILAVSLAALELYARLTLRAGVVFRVAGLRYAVADAWPELVDAGLVTLAVPDDRAVDDFDVPALRGHRWVDEPVLQVLHARLLRRLGVLAGIDRSLLVPERLALLVWATYAPTPGGGLFPDRRALTTWERARRGEWLDDDEPARLAAAGPRAFGPSPYGHAVEAVLAAAPSADVLARIPGVRPRLVLQLEAEGRVGEALALCRGGDPDPVVALQLARTGRRLARATRAAWPPKEPLREAPVRRIQLARTGGGVRPLWSPHRVPVEAALVAWLGEHGREAVHAENTLWTSLYALVFRDLYFLPIAGRLPTTRRGGPLDLGTPEFYRARREAIDRRLGVLGVDGPSGFVEGWRGERLSGLGDPDLVLPLVAAVPPALAATILGRLAREGWAAGRGLPDLFVKSGPAVRLDASIPSGLDGDVILAEVKGPTDALRDEQRVWIDALLRSGNRVELWEVVDAPLR